jgi:hypothetical protein
VSVELGIAHARKRLLAAATSPDETVFLRLGGVHAAHQPGVVWKVYLGRSAFVGNVALYGTGQLSFSFPVDRALRAALGAGVDELAIRFVPTGPTVNGRPTAPKSAATVTVARLSLAISS